MTDLSAELRKEYLIEDLTSDRIAVHEFKNVKDFEHFLKKMTGFKLFGSSIKSFKILLGAPLGEGEHPKTKAKGLLYKIYGIASQNKKGYLLGRLIPGQMRYSLTLDDYATSYQVTEHFALTNDIMSSTKQLLDQIEKDERTQVAGAIVDYDKEMVVLTSILPAELDANLKAAKEEILNGSTKSKDQDDTVKLVEEKSGEQEL